MSKKEFPIEKMTPVIVRNERWLWKPAFFDEIIGRYKAPFGTFEGFHEMMAPLAGNEKRIGTEDDAWDLWDRERLVEEGII